MTPRSFLLSQELTDYVRAASEPPDPIAADLLAETAALAERGEAPATFQIAQEQGTFMQLLTRAGLGDRIELRLGDAHESLRALPEEPVFDLAFVDADKAGYADYIDQLHPRLRTDGVVLLDNTLRDGRVLDPETDDDRAVVALNAALAADQRWETVLLPLADGLTMLRKR